MVFSKFSTYKNTLLIFGLTLLLLFSSLLPLSAKPLSRSFPSYSVIRNNITFWEKIYSVYSTNTAVVHDKNNLAIVYTALHLFDPTLPGARKINKPIVQNTKKKYARILKKLSQGGTPATADEKRVAALFKGRSARNKMRQAATNIRVQMGLKERFREGVIRSGAYFTEIKRILRTYNLPTDLAYLPHVESSFNLKAYSKFGAAGIWQFTRSTGKEFMTINYVVDERKDPFAATHAAAKFLKRNYASLGTWPLAITAYNYGPSGMLRALKSKGDYQNIFRSYREGHFKFAARNFYAEFLAARNIAKQQERNPRLKLDPPLAARSLRLPGFVHANDISHHLKINTATLKQLNPSLLSPVYKGEKYIPKGFLLKIPPGAANRRLLAKIPSHIFKDNQKRSRYYRVQRGDTANKIALAHSVRLKDLSRANNLNTQATVYIGQKLRIPSSVSAATKNRPATVIASASKQKHYGSTGRRLAQTRIPVFKDTKKVSPALQLQHVSKSATNLNITSYKKRNGIHYGTIMAQPEESLALYAEWLKTSKKHLRKLNNLSKTKTIHPGQKITLTFDRVSRAIFENKRLDYHQNTEEDFYTAFQITGLKNYKVSPGDTLWHLCYNKFELPFWLLKKYNSKLDFDKLVANQSLTIPIIKAL